jgi:hypothetical protein
VNRPLTPGLAALARAAACVAVAAGVAAAQPAAGPRRPDEGGRTVSLGQPQRWLPAVGLVSGVQARPEERAAVSELRVGAYREFANRVLGLAGVHAELYTGLLDTRGTAGARLRVASPFLRAAAGADYNVETRRWRPHVSLLQPVRRGGLFHDGTVLRVDLFGGHEPAFMAGIETPLRRGAPVGKTRPPRDHVPLHVERPPTHVAPVAHPAVRAAMATVRGAAANVRWLTVPWLDHTGAGGDASDRAVEARLDSLRERLDTLPGDPAVPALERETRRLHRAVDLAFSLAVALADPLARVDSPAPPAPTPVGERVGREARRVLLDEVLLPWDRLLGQDKRDDSLAPFVLLARGAFLRRLHVARDVPPDAIPAAFAVFAELLDIVDAARADASREWGSARYAWLPLQFALHPEDHDSQAELDALLTRATGQPFLDGNEVSYVVNEQFQWQLNRTIREAEDYHVLWIHDVRGHDARGDPDEMSFRHVLHSYLATLTERVRAYDRTGRLPTYFILLDQFFYEQRGSRLWMTLLEDPLRHRVSLPRGFAAWEDSLAAAQAALRAAVDGSALLAAQRRQFGEAWLRNLVKVHVSITNVADPTFWSWRLATGFPVPDTWMRDHRKIVLYDVGEDDPYRGEAMLTGAGVGEHYANLSWEDRSLLLRGPAALALKDAARQLLEQQGIRGTRLPAALAARPKAADYEQRVAARGRAGPPLLRASILQNGTGHDRKDITVAKAILYTLMPPGSVIKIPDSLWNGTFWGSALLGCALRGGRVLLVTPAFVNAPARSFGSIIRSRELLWRLITASRVLAGELGRHGGFVKVGLFNAAQPVTNIPAKVLAVRNTLREHAWLHALFDFPPSVYDGLEALAAQYAAAPVAAADSTDFESRGNPQLHMKANFFASREAWRVMAREEWVTFTREYVPRRMTQVAARDAAVGSFGPNPDALIDVGATVVQAWYDALPAAERDRVVFLTLLGSANQNERSFLSDGEVAVALSNWPPVIPYLDLLSIIGQSRWVETTAELDALLPPRGALLTRVAHWFKAMF